MKTKSLVTEKEIIKDIKLTEIENTKKVILQVVEEKSIKEGDQVDHDIEVDHLRVTQEIKEEIEEVMIEDIRESIDQEVVVAVVIEFKIKEEINENISNVKYII
jgi:hypothetical protein